MRIELRFGLILAACFVFGVAVAGYISYTLEFRQAQAQVNERSRVLLEMGLALRNYTSKQIAPLVTELGFKEFHPQMVPSYGAQTALAALQQRFPDFRYRESSLNPTAIEDRATDWEVGLLRAFQADPELKELSGETGRADAQHFCISKNRHGRFRDSDLLRRLFEATVRRCMAEGIVGGQGFAVDASMIRADAHRQKGVANREELDRQETTRAVSEYLAVLDEVAFRGTTEVAPKFISPTDPAARWTAATGGPACFAYCDNYLIDLEHAVIVDVKATTVGRQAEVGAAQTMLTRTADRFGLQPERLVADTGYGSAAIRGRPPHHLTGVSLRPGAVPAPANLGTCAA